MKKVILTCLIISILPLSTIKAQIKPGDIIAGSQADINYLANGYLQPFGNALSSSLNNGWYQTAKTHNLGRFDIMVTPTIVFIPDADKFFTINNSELDQLQLVSGASAESPTAFGDKSSGPSLEYRSTPPGVPGFQLPQGIDLSAIFMPMAKISVGLIKNTEISLRYFPTISVPGVDDGELSVSGFGIKHDILQWIPGGKLLPFSVSGFFGYTKVDYSQTIGTNQTFELSTTGYTVRALISKKLLFITPYAGIGYNSGSTEINLKGDFQDPLGVVRTNPINIEADGASGLVGNIGVQFKFLFLVAASIDYTFGDYQALTIGAGVSLDF